MVPGPRNAYGPFKSDRLTRVNVPFSRSHGSSFSSFYDDGAARLDDAETLKMPQAPF
jgi:hypothetical protein